MGEGFCPSVTAPGTWLYIDAETCTNMCIDAYMVMMMVMAMMVMIDITCYTLHVVY